MRTAELISTTGSVRAWEGALLGGAALLFLLLVLTSLIRVVVAGVGIVVWISKSCADAFF